MVPDNGHECLCRSVAIMHGKHSFSPLLFCFGFLSLRPRARCHDEPVDVRLGPGLVAALGLHQR